MSRAWAPALMILAGLVALVVVLAQLQAIGLADHGRVVQLHHGYIGGGLALVLRAVSVRWELPMWARIVAAMLILLGAWWLADDLYQHIRQFREPFYRSPWHKWAAAIGVI